jgi:hypothetical protein
VRDAFLNCNGSSAFVPVFTASPVNIIVSTWPRLFLSIATVYDFVGLPPNALASAVILGSESHGNRDHIHCLRFETFQPGTPRPRIYVVYPPGTGWPSYIPRHWVPISSPPTTRRDTMEVFEPTSRETHYISATQAKGKRQSFPCTGRGGP